MVNADGPAASRLRSAMALLVRSPRIQPRLFALRRRGRTQPIPPTLSFLSILLSMILPAILSTITGRATDPGRPLDLCPAPPPALLARSRSRADVRSLAPGFISGSPPGDRELQPVPVPPVPPESPAR